MVSRISGSNNKNWSGEVLPRIEFGQFRMVIDFVWVLGKTVLFNEMLY